MQVTRHLVDVTTDASGDFSDTIQDLTGVLLQIRYVPDGSSPLATGADVTITENNTGVEIFTQANIGASAFQRAPKQLNHLNTDGSALTTHDYIACQGPATLVIAQGGNALSGKFYLYMGS